MAKYRKIDTRIWNDERFRQLDPLEQLVAIYCITAQSNRIGIFRFSIALAAEDLDMLPDELIPRLDRVCHTLSWRHDSERRVLYFPTWWKYNHPGSSKTFRGLLTDLHEVPNTPLLNDFAHNTRYLDSLSDTLSDFFGKGMPYQEQEQEQEQEQDLTKRNETKRNETGNGWREFANELVDAIPTVVPVGGTIPDNDRDTLTRLAVLRADGTIPDDAWQSAIAFVQRPQRGEPRGIGAFFTKLAKHVPELGKLVAGVDASTLNTEQA